MDKERVELYESLEKSIGRTPLYEIRNINTGKNRVFAKEEYSNPTGSHYDRVFLYLLWQLEKKGVIMPKHSFRKLEKEGGPSQPLGKGGKRKGPFYKLVETTSGNAGASFAWLCSILGYEPYVVIPEDMPSVRHAYIQQLGGILRFSERGKYAMGTIERVREMLDKNNDLWCPNHSIDERALIGMKKAAKEIISVFRRKKIKLDYFVAALGAGVHLRGMWEEFRQNSYTKDTKIIGMEPFECPDNFLKKYGKEKFIEKYKARPILRKHELLGTGEWAGASRYFVNMDAVREHLYDIVCVRPERWEEMQRQLIEKEHKLPGRTSAACLAAALDYAKEKDLSNKNFLIIFYDHSWKYLDLDRRPVEKSF